MATEVKPIKRVIGTFSDNPVYDEMLHKLAELSAAWGSTKAPALVQRYNVVLLSLVELGFNDSLDIDICLPDQLMALEYHDDGWRESTPLVEIIKN